MSQRPPGNGDRKRTSGAGSGSAGPTRGGKSGGKAGDKRPSSGPRKAPAPGGKPRPEGGKPRSTSGKPGGAGGRSRTGTDRPDSRRPDTRRPSRVEADRPRDPHIPDEVTADQLDVGVAHELRTLPEGLAEIVARHLVAADLALVDGDIPAARAHIAAAKRRAGRVAPVREAAGIAAYLAGDYTEAIAELRTVRRMTGSVEYVPMLADCERGLGRPHRALEIIKEVDQRRLDPETRVELTLVAAGARADLGQLDAAIVLLQIPELTGLPKGAPRARLQYAYADLLARADREDEARTWMRRAAASDVDGVTDAAERVEEEDSLTFSEEDLDETDGLGEG